MFVTFSTTNAYVPVDHIVMHSCDTRNVLSNSCNCQKIIRVTRVKYLGLIIDWILPSNISDMVMRLRSVIFRTYKSNKIVPNEFMCIVPI